MKLSRSTELAFLAGVASGLLMGLAMWFAATVMS